MHTDDIHFEWNSLQKSIETSSYWEQNLKETFQDSRHQAAVVKTNNFLKGFLHHVTTNATYKSVMSLK